MIFNYQNKKYELILLCVTGSRMYGTQYEKGEHPLMPEYVSDYDYRGVIVAHEDEKVGLNKTIEQLSPSPEKPKEIEMNDELVAALNKGGLNLENRADIVLYEVRKFVKMASEQNPNILDLLFTDEEATIYVNKKGKKILDNKKEFLSKNVINRFLGYASQQLHRIKSHNKHIVKKPLHNDVIHGLQDAYADNRIDFTWINVKFSGQLAQMISGKTQQEANTDKKLENPISMRDFNKEYLSKISEKELQKYAKPEIINYLKLKDLHGKEFKLRDTVATEEENIKFDDFLKNKASFRKITNSFYNIFDGGRGFLSRNNDIKNVEPEITGDFISHCSVDKQRFSNDLDEVLDFWDWRVNRNPKRSALEEKFGYDTKHAGHLIRLMESAQEIMQTCDYTPRLNDEKKKLIKSVIEGHFTYEEILKRSDESKKKIMAIKGDTNLIDDKDLNREKINSILLGVSYLDKKNIRKLKH